MQTVFSLCFLLILGPQFLRAVEKKVSNVQIKIADPPSQNRYNPAPSYEKTLTLRMKPANVSGPPHLQQLAGECFVIKHEGYTYNICPFHNVTQKEDRVSWSSFHGVLGVWQEWIVEGDTFTGMRFVMGERCGAIDRETELMFNCSTVTLLHSIKESSTCRYIITMDTPLACFKGAMQVYHTLSAEQLEEWDLIHEEYYNGEITHQGLMKRRRRLLTKAGIFYDFEKYKEEEKATEEREKEWVTAITTAPRGDDPNKETLYIECLDEKGLFLEELNKLKMNLKKMAQDHPDIVAKYINVSSLENTTTTASPVAVKDTDVHEDRETVEAQEKEREEEKEEEEGQVVDYDEQQLEELLLQETELMNGLT